ncbi:MAG: hypothetical protein NC912_06765 [Candidatus Omnitrophica bacterium]|nr:hypothetical protein [Candidatus Omnitrophota bacterium]
MAEQESPTPEKQLLKLIEEPRLTEKFSPVILKRFGLGFFSFSALKARLSFLRKKIKEDFQTGKIYKLNIKVINHLLGFTVFFMSVYFIGNLFGSMGYLKKISEFELKETEKKLQIDSQLGPPLQIALHDLEKVRQRNIFKIGSLKTNEDLTIKTPSPKIVEVTQHLKLVGISWSADPDAMIEDTKINKTFFLKRGQMLGEIKVQAIFRDRVILSYEGEEIELR